MQINKRIDKHDKHDKPTGLTVAITLAKAGYSVTIFEWKSKIGGLLQYVIPEFLLPKSMLDKFQARLEEMEIQIRLKRLNVREFI